MFKWFKKYFVPHKVNNYRPHIFRGLSVFIILLTVFALFLVAVSGRFLVSTDFTALVLPKVLVDYANKDRDAKNYSHLAINPVLEKAAQLKANDMAEKGYFAHKSPDGKTPWYWFKEAGYDFSYAGENLAVNFNDSVDVNTAWMNSPGHRDNIMNNNFSEVGIATADGMYKGRMTTFVVQLFGRPAKSVSTISASKEVPKVVSSKPQSSSNIGLGSNSSSVLSESTSTEVTSENGTTELFVSVEKTPVATTVSPQIKYSSFIERILLSPERTLSFVYLFIALLVVIGLIFTVFVEFRAHNIRAVMLALGILFVIFGLLYIYKSIIIEPVMIV